MKINIFGVDMKLTDMIIYWKKDVNMDDIMDDLAVIGELINRPRFQKKGCRISTVRTWQIDDTEYRTCEIVANKDLVDLIENSFRGKMFKAVVFTETFMTK